MFPCVGKGVFVAQEQPFEYYDCKTFLPILANFASNQSHPWRMMCFLLKLKTDFLFGNFQVIFANTN